ncbi:hypothetical protein GR255_24685, partial [Mycobacterium tuberculosis]|nr:hypothetical protein [Mycobacterium tuberculosis]
NARKYVLKLEEISGCRISAIGVGPDRDQTIVVRRRAGASGCAHQRFHRPVHHQAGRADWPG